MDDPTASSVVEQLENLERILHSYESLIGSAKGVLWALNYVSLTDRPVLAIQVLHAAAEDFAKYKQSADAALTELLAKQGIKNAASEDTEH